MASFKHPAYCVFNAFTLYYRSVALRLVPVAEHLEVMGLFAEHHEILTYLIPLCEPAAILLAENMTALMCAVSHVTTNTRVLEEKKNKSYQAEIGCVCDFSFTFVCCLFIHAVVS